MAEQTAGCHLCAVLRKQCEECQRRLAWGTVNRALVELADGSGRDHAILLSAVEAVAFLMQERTALVYRHRRDMRDEALAAQRGAQDTYFQGLADGRRDERGQW